MLTASVKNRELQNGKLGICPGLDDRFVAVPLAAEVKGRREAVDRPRYRDAPSNTTYLDSLSTGGGGLGWELCLAYQSALIIAEIECYQ